MKSKYFFTVMSLIAFFSLTSCNGEKHPTSVDTDMDKTIIGTFHYETMTRTVLDNPTDTLFRDFTCNPEEHQYYDVYLPDSVLMVYETQNDSLLFIREYRYIFRNDSIFAENDEKKLNVRVVNATDSILQFDYTRVQNDTTYHFQTTSRRTELPAWLKKQINQL